MENESGAKVAGERVENGLPGLRGTENIALNVPDLKEAIDFFTDVIGCEVFYSFGPFKDPEGDWFSVNLDVHPRAEIPEIVLLRCATGANFELFEYHSPDQVQRMPKMSDYGGMHIAFYVDDIDQAINYLKSKGVRMLGEKKEGIGPEAGEGSYFIHFLTPWGLMLELVSFPQGKEYMKDRERHLWRPDAPDS